VYRLAHRAIDAIRRVKAGRRLPGDHPFRWMHAFGADDLDALKNEIVPLTDSDDALVQLFDTWRKSAEVAESGVVDQALNETSDPVPLTPPKAKERTKALTVRLGDDDFETLKRIAKEEGIAHTALARRFIQRGIRDLDAEESDDV
jgi:hypothetical protein